MLTTTGTPLNENDVLDLVERTGYLDHSDKRVPSADHIVDRMMYAQNNNASYHYGVTTVQSTNRSTLQNTWGYYSVTSETSLLYDIVILTSTSTNMTLIRSENISEAPVPMEKCEKSNAQNEAYGGKLGRSDCLGNKRVDDPKFFGQVDTAAVMVAHGLGDGRSSSSAKSLNNDAFTWIRNNAEAIESLLTARAYSVSIDASLVQISVDKLIVAVSHLQLALSCLALVMAIVLWLALMVLADAHWASSLLANLVHSTAETSSTKPGYMMRDPKVALQSVEKRKLLAVNGRLVTLHDAVPYFDAGLVGPQQDGIDSKRQMETEAYPVNYSHPHAGREGLMAGFERTGA
ncbi:hypothetical protein NW768_008367 [Fusarium equiseti]|uniref:Uncharacterized protein n=1 Tax=Fusarium equiseti TaxID=61235 RepID=A0ABQ8R6J6_FUSEQ|nr:hypothetical protein NW768_008367 [Fusarium equiseti]